MPCTSDCDDAAAAPVRAAILLPAGRSRVWQERAALALDGLPGVQCRIVRVRAAPREHDAQWRRWAAAHPELQELRVDDESDAAAPADAADARDAAGVWDVVIDLADVADPAPWRARSRFGVWQPLDAQGLHLAAPYAGHASIVSGRGGELTLVRDGATALETMRYYADPDYPRALGRAYLGLLYLLAAGLLELVHGGEPAAAAFVAQAPRSRWRRVAAGLRGRWRSQLRRWRGQWLSESWMIGVVDAPIEQTLQGRFAERIRWLGGRDALQYRADPFGLPGEDRLLYCETYDYRDGIGRLERLRLDADGAVAQADPAGPQRPGHVSYPYVFEHAGRTYAIPETAQRRCCELYEIDAHGRWRFVATLLDDVAAADASLFAWEGRFWLAYTDLSWGAFDNLCLSYADDLRGPWRRHARHPVKLDHRSSRPAGTPFVHDGALYRPAQDCTGGYGQAVALNRVRLCTPQRYREEVVTHCRPDPRGRNPHGLHTVSAWGARTLVDGKRYVFNLHELGRKLRRRYGAAAQTVGV
ncbi:hypothetical protein GLE_2463 [Lysobacter enzymogenes]|uniref:Glucosamine inositolphosphorylceramide transferase 1 N-terminal domain-containing protein n=1 Tax=Lysobacter enzymogenes TaxID=69 RepID=A0A0S2DH85_LYSEN|nr:hypothetical protein [Lysobacter enzymogenes]ALN57812.1 hypothetical protein GLE_2463 [Lysobacter enzymogenes]